MCSKRLCIVGTQGSSAIDETLGFLCLEILLGEPEASITVWALTYTTNLTPAMPLY